MDDPALEGPTIQVWHNGFRITTPPGFDLEKNKAEFDRAQDIAAKAFSLLHDAGGFPSVEGRITG